MTAPVDEISERAFALRARNGRRDGTQLEDRLEAEDQLQPLSRQAQQLAEKSPPEIGQLLQAILHNTTAVVYVKDVQGRYLLINHRYETLFEVTQEKIAGRTDSEIFPADIAAAVRANDLRVLAAQAPLEFEEVVPHDGVMRTYISLKFPISGPGEVPYAVCGVSTDITRRKEAQRRLVAEHAVTRALATSLTFDDAAPPILQAVCECLGWEVAVFWSVDQHANALRCVAVWYAPMSVVPALDRLSRETTVTPGVGLLGQVWASGKPGWIADVAANADCPRSAAVLGTGLHGTCAYPVRNGGEILGVLEFFSQAIREPGAEVLDMMASVSSQISQFIERKQAEKVLHQREREFGLARAIQQKRLPRTAVALAGFDVAGSSRPAQETGGDYLDFIPLPDGSLGVAVGDASGHGIAAALLMAETRAYLRALARTDTDVGRVLTLVNHHMTEDIDGDDFVTLLLARIDPRTRSLVYGSAGHWPGYVLDGRGEVRRVLRSTGLPLGVDPEGVVPGAAAVALEPGDLLLLLTDGVAEAFSPDGPLFGMERALDCVRAQRGRPSSEIIAALFDEVRAFSRDLQIDDMTAIVIKVAQV